MKYCSILHGRVSVMFLAFNLNLIEVKSMQRSGNEAIRTQSQPSEFNRDKRLVISVNFQSGIPLKSVYRFICTQSQSFLFSCTKEIVFNG